LETFRIAPDEKILLRVINGGVSQELMFAIEEHPLTIVAADGVAVQPMKVRNGC
jgi:FtsP/CotA-like multicopper oxidase with cupredoxin domain